MKKNTLLAMGLAASCALPFQSAQALDIAGLLGFAGGIFNQASFPESDAYTTDDDIIIDAFDGVELAANIFCAHRFSGGRSCPCGNFY